MASVCSEENPEGSKGGEAWHNAQWQNKLFQVKLFKVFLISPSPLSSNFLLGPMLCLFCQALNSIHLGSIPY